MSALETLLVSGSLNSFICLGVYGGVIVSLNHIKSSFIIHPYESIYLHTYIIIYISYIYIYYILYILYIYYIIYMYIILYYIYIYLFIYINMIDHSNYIFIPWNIPIFHHPKLGTVSEAMALAGPGTPRGHSQGEQSRPGAARFFLGTDLLKRWSKERKPGKWWLTRW